MSLIESLSQWGLKYTKNRSHGDNNRTIYIYIYKYNLTLISKIKKIIKRKGKLLIFINDFLEIWYILRKLSHVNAIFLGGRV